MKGEVYLEFLILLTYTKMCIMILFIGPVNSMGGPAIKNKILLKYMKTKNFKVINSHKKDIFSRIKTILSLLFTSSNQIIIAVSSKGRLVLYPILLLKHILNSNLRTVLICIGGRIQDEIKGNNTFLYKTLTKADIVAVETNTQKRILHNKFNFENVFYFPNYKDYSLEEFFVKYNIEKEQHISLTSDSMKFIFLSSVRNAKGVKTMIKAFVQILDQYPNVALDIYGPIRKDFDKSVFDQLYNLKQINYQGVVDNKNVIQTMRKYDVFLFPSEYEGEGFPAVIIEAYLSGLFVIASDINYNSEIVAHSINGYIFQSGNVEALKEALLQTIQKPKKTYKRGLRNIEYAKKFNAKLVVESLLEEMRKKSWRI